MKTKFRNKKVYRYFRIRGNFHAISLPYDMNSKREVKEFIKRWGHVDRLPYGTEIW